MFELAMFLPVLLKFSLFHVAITGIVCELASPISLKYISWQKCGKAKGALIFDQLGFIPNSDPVQVALACYFFGFIN